MDKEKDHMIVIDNDGFNVGLLSHFAETWLEFDNREQAFEIADHWNAWLKECQ